MYTWIFVSGIIFTFYNAWGGGANDCANSFATAVGSKTLTLKQAVLVATIFEFTGAVLMGSHVMDAVRKNIVSEDLFTNNPGALMFGMLCANLASALWLTFATYLKWPVSTTHSIIGAIIGFSLAYGGADGINWDKVGLIVASWFASPIIASLASCSAIRATSFECFKIFCP
jgi:PiT family inorganic phosphate transporter